MLFPSPSQPISRHLTCCINPRKHQKLIKLSGQYQKNLRLMMETIKPIIDDVMVVDWIFNYASVSPNPGSAMRVAFLKLKSKNEKDEVLEVVGGIRDQLEMIQ
ncbi:hypothetical protein Tco_0358715 [Tanacetum coccineum]